MTDRPTKRQQRAKNEALLDELFEAHASRRPATRTQKTKAFECVYGDLNAAVAQPPSGNRMLAVIPVAIVCVVLVLVVLLLGGCANPIDPALRRSVESIERAWPVIRDKSVPAAGVDPAAHARATASMDRAVQKAGEAARHE